MSQVILVNGQDEPIGVMDKQEAHEKAFLHRAFSIFIFNDAGEMLMQQRAEGKYHSPGLWTNACCSHPAPGEETIDAAHRRLREELGFDTPLDYCFSFTYKAVFDNGLTEHEYDHVYTGKFQGEFSPDPAEVQAHASYPTSWIENDLQEYPERYTEWFKIAFPKLLRFMNNPSNASN
ncbi:MAG: isopentenyl-diphosphate delta-isomerase [Ferruginibacter sp.]|nr:isopentenyl-diphosphate delta-isomerase [Ferruginibacter sp.]